MSRPNGTNGARVIQVIETTTLRGEGTERDKCREVKQYWNFAGDFLAESDSCQQEKANYDMQYQKGNTIDFVGNGFLHAFDEEDREIKIIQPNQTEDFRVRVSFQDKTFFLVRIFKYNRMMEIVQDGLNMLFKNT